ncbi:S1 family peptidase [Caenispirillum bisanense]|uniref:Trypsin-like peptidase domain-containing protein n=1 Tax=Caenispirillum bisanense TaxID=414052 RepID=A0A286G5R8_9PROT|nr:serine protease [Caenispirillum bisanense]SOD90881.1 Trypsin-like peptidase domain-containing protein [Caenispirillum bisanense]
MRLAAALLPPLLATTPAAAAPDAGDLRSLIAQVAPAVVALGTYEEFRSPPIALRGTGFAVDDGRLVVTNAHVLPRLDDLAAREKLAVVLGKGKMVELLFPVAECRDEGRDLLVLRLAKANRIPAALTLAPELPVAPGMPVAFTGFPLTGSIGLVPVTHRGMVSAVSPAAVPAAEAGTLDARTVARLRDNFDIYQLDATAYPGNSGSPLYETAGGRVVGILNSVYVKSTKESALTDPSGITYAIPVARLQPLLARARAGECEPIPD